MRGPSATHPNPALQRPRAGWLLWLLASVSAVALALASLGSFRQAWRQDQALSVVVTPGKSVVIPLPTPFSSARGLGVRLACREGRGCGGLSLWLGGVPAAVTRRESGWTEFSVSVPGARYNSLRIANLGRQPAELASLRVQNYVGVSNNFPRLALLYQGPLERRLGSGTWLLPLLLALLAQGWAFFLWQRSGSSFWGWRTGVWLLPPLLGLAAAGTLWTAGLRLLLSWDAYFLLVKIGPFSLTVMRLWRARRSSPRLARALTWACLLAAFLAVSALVLYSEAQQRGSAHPTALIYLGKHFARDPRWVPRDAVLQQEAYGYDGQFFLYMAQDPWARLGAWANIDSPAYRYQRVLYPFLLNLLSGGDKQRLPFLMLALNLALLLAAFLVMVRLAGRLGAPLPWALFFLASYGLFQPVYLGLSEPLANLLLALSLYALTAGALWWAALAMGLMVLGKEYYAVVPALGAVWTWLLRRRGLICFLLPLACGLVWQLMLWQRFGHPAWEQSNPGNFTWPLKGALGLLASPAHFREVLVVLGFLALLALSAALLARDWRRLDLWLLASLLLVPLWGGQSIWGHNFSYPRVLSPAYLAYLAVLFKERTWWAAAPGALFGGQAALRLLQI